MVLQLLGSQGAAYETYPSTALVRPFYESTPSRSMWTMSQQRTPQKDIIVIVWHSWTRVETAQDDRWHRSSVARGRLGSSHIHLRSIVHLTGKSTYDVWAGVVQCWDRGVSVERKAMQSQASSITVAPSLPHTAYGGTGGTSYNTACSGQC